MRSKKDKEIKEVIIFFVITICLSFFVFWGPLALFKIQTINLIEGTRGPVWAIILFIMGGFVPSLTGIILTRIYEGKQGLTKLFKKSLKINIGLKWYALMILVVLFLASALIAIYTILGGEFNYSQFLIQLPTFIPLILLGPLSEEYGWRGFAIERLLKKASPNVTSLLIGLTWSFWHLPLFFIKGSSQYEFDLPFLVFLISVTGVSFAFTYFYIKTEHSIFSAIFLHWIYTYVMQVVNTTVARTNLYNWLEFAPSLLIGIIFAFLLHRVAVNTN